MHFRIVQCILYVYCIYIYKYARFTSNHFIYVITRVTGCEWLWPSSLRAQSRRRVQFLGHITGVRVRNVLGAWSLHQWLPRFVPDIFRTPSCRQSPGSESNRFARRSVKKKKKRSPLDRSKTKTDAVFKRIFRVAPAESISRRDPDKRYSTRA